MYIFIQWLYTFPEETHIIQDIICDSFWKAFNLCNNSEK